MLKSKKTNIIIPEIQKVAEKEDAKKLSREESESTNSTDKSDSSVQVKKS